MRWLRARPMAASIVRSLLSVVVALAGACTYGPVEHSASVTQVVRLGDTHRAIIVLRLDTFRRPTRLSAFPDGGKWRYSARGSAQYLVDALGRDVALLAEQDAPSDVWESFDSRIVGLEGDSVGYLRLTGCPKGGECHPALQHSRVYRLSVRGNLGAVDSVPDGAGLPGQMAARRPNEQNYVRFGTIGDTVTGRFEEGGEGRPLFWVRSDGSLQVVGG